MIFISCTLRVAPIRLVKCFSICSVHSRSHYDSLGLTPHATQADVKSAYYKMSMQFHPDKNKGSEEAANQFRAITEAYEVLGNLKLRKLYDKGILHTASPQFTQHKEETTPDSTETNFYRSREQRSRPPPPKGKTAIYNFDEWTYMHYGKSFARREAAKARYERVTEEEGSDRSFLYTEVFFFGTVIGLTLISLSYIRSVGMSYDVVEDSDMTHPSNSSPASYDVVKNSDTRHPSNSSPTAK